MTGSSHATSSFKRITHLYCSNFRSKLFPLLDIISSGTLEYTGEGIFHLAFQNGTVSHLEKEAEYKSLNTQNTTILKGLGYHGDHSVLKIIPKEKKRSYRLNASAALSRSQHLFEKVPGRAAEIRAVPPGSWHHNVMWHNDVTSGFGGGWRQVHSSSSFLADLWHHCDVIVSHDVLLSHCRHPHLGTQPCAWKFAVAWWKPTGKLQLTGAPLEWHPGHMPYLPYLRNTTESGGMYIFQNETRTETTQCLWLEIWEMFNCNFTYVVVIISSLVLRTSNTGPGYLRGDNSTPALSEGKRDTVLLLVLKQTWPCVLSGDWLGAKYKLSWAPWGTKCTLNASRFPQSSSPYESSNSANSSFLCHLKETASLGQPKNLECSHEWNHTWQNIKYSF